MNQLVQDWLDACEAVRAADRRAEAALESAYVARVDPANLRPAKPADIVEGNIIWYPSWADEDEDRIWRMVEEVYRPSDPWKAYCSDDGCRYGLDGAFVEVATTDKEDTR